MYGKSILRKLSTIATVIRCGSDAQATALCEQMRMLHAADLLAGRKSKHLSFANSLLKEAVDFGRMRDVKRCLDAGACPNTMAGYSPVAYVAAERGNPEILRMLIAAGADVNGRCLKNGWTILQRAARSGSMGCVKVLLAAGANPTLDGGHSSVLARCFHYHDVAAVLRKAERSWKGS